jgi:glycosyltransferase involved in cell wall biosynthesis
MKKVAIVANQWFPSGGVEQVAVDIASALKSQTTTIRLIGFRSGNSDLEGLNQLPKERILNPRSRLLSCLISRLKLNSYFEMVSANEWSSCDSVIFTHLNCLLRLRSVARKMDCVLWLHGLEIWGDKARVLKDFVDSKLRIVCVSQFTAAQVKKVFPENRIHVVPNMVDTNRFSPTTEPERIRRFEILIVGRLTAHRPKGHEILLRVLPRIQRATGASVRLTIVGDGNDLNRLKAMATKLGVDDSVSFLGRVSDEILVELYQHCGVFCMPALTGVDSDGNWFGEGFGIVYIQAAACARPVIASKEGGAPETIIDGKSGIVVDPSDEDELVSAICRVLGDESLSRAMGLRGRSLVEDKFSFKKFKSSIVSILK